MAIPFIQQAYVGAYLMRQRLARKKRYPLVLMLEPLFRCNLACAGCGKIDYPDEILNQRLSYDDCMAAIDECGAPMVSIAGGEPLLHRDMPKIVRGFMAKKKFVILCTNALLLKKKIDDYEPSPFFTWSIHLDGDQRHARQVGAASTAYSRPRATRSCSRRARASARRSTARCSTARTPRGSRPSSTR